MRPHCLVAIQGSWVRYDASRQESPIGASWHGNPFERHSRARCLCPGSTKESGPIMHVPSRPLPPAPAVRLGSCVRRSSWPAARGRRGPAVKRLPSGTLRNLCNTRSVNTQTTSSRSRAHRTCAPAALRDWLKPRKRWKPQVRDHSIVRIHIVHAVPHLRLRGHTWLVGSEHCGDERLPDAHTAVDEPIVKLEEGAKGGQGRHRDGLRG